VCATIAQELLVLGKRAVGPVGDWRPRLEDERLIWDVRFVRWSRLERVLGWK
jgi:hypothetical protein